MSVNTHMLLFSPWRRWVHLDQEDQWDQSNPEGG